jgi:hypothetical protein
MRSLAVVGVLLVALLTLGAGYAAAVDPPEARIAFGGHATLDVPCGSGRPVAADWYFPRDAAGATGIVWLQHGFLRTKRNVATLALRIATSTGAVVVAPTISSNPFEAGGCWINGDGMHMAVARLFADRTALETSAHAAGWQGTLPRPFVLAGHSAGGNLAVAAAGFTTASGGAIDDLRAVVMLDGVDFAGQTAAALSRLTGAARRPVLQLASPPSPCNASGASTQALLATRPGEFVGVQLQNGTHLDAEGRDTDLLGVLVCGLPRPRNVLAVQRIASDWTANALTGSSLGIVDGAPGETVAVGSATAVVLPA